MLSSTESVCLSRKLWNARWDHCLILLCKVKNVIPFRNNFFLRFDLITKQLKSKDVNLFAVRIGCMSDDLCQEVYMHFDLSRNVLVRPLSPVISADLQESRLFRPASWSLRYDQPVVSVSCSSLIAVPWCAVQRRPLRYTHDSARSLVSSYLRRLRLWQSDSWITA